MAAERLTMSGYMYDSSNGEPLIGASIYVKELKQGVVTNVNGYYVFTLPEGVYNVELSYIGYATQRHRITLSRSLSKDFSLEQQRVEIAEIVVTSDDPSRRLEKPQMGVEKLPISDIRKIPAFMGEVDIIKAIQLLPGVQAVSEGTSAFSVRGGTPDQNLVLLDGATVYNASHLMGFFSVFNNDIVKDVTLYKGDIPATQGGRLSSLMEVDTKDGNDQRFSTQGGLGLISARLLLEGPIVKDKLSIWGAGRTSYADIFLPLVGNNSLSDTKLNFFDINGRISWKINDKNRIFLSGYWGQDFFKMQQSTMFRFSNKAATLKWNSIIQPNLYVSTSIVSSWYDYNLEAGTDLLTGAWKAAIEDYGLRHEYTWLIDNNNKFMAGLSSSFKIIHSGNAELIQDNADPLAIDVPVSQSLESAIFVSNEQKIGAVTLRYGLRFSLFNNIGPRKEVLMDENYHKIGSQEYAAGAFYNTYWGIEPRVALSWRIIPTISVKASYSHSVQYLHLLQTSTAGTPLDVWIASNPNIKPQSCDQISIGYFHNVWNDNLTLSAEGYYKFLHNVVDFKDFATVILNTDVDTELRIGKGNAYGIELMARKQKGNLTGWISYTYSRSFRTIPEVNQGMTYRSPSDRPHSVNVVLSYSPLKWLSIGMNWVYATGQPISAPEGRYIINDFGKEEILPVYTGRNQYRMSDYHRLDLSATFDLNSKNKGRYNHEINISTYNTYARKNPWMINFRTDKETHEQYAEMTYLFSIVPSISYNFKF